MYRCPIFTGAVGVVWTISANLLDRILEVVVATTTLAKIRPLAGGLVFTTFGTYHLFPSQCVQFL